MIHDVCSVTLIPPETPHDQWFLDTYEAMIREAVDKCREDDVTPRHCYEPFKALFHAMVTRASKRSSLTLRCGLLRETFGIVI